MSQIQQGVFLYIFVHIELFPIRGKLLILPSWQVFCQANFGNYGLKDALVNPSLVVPYLLLFLSPIGFF